MTDTKKQELDNLRTYNLSLEATNKEISQQIRSVIAEIEECNHKLFFLNSDIDMFETFLRQRQKEQEQTKRQQEDQKKQVFNKFTESTDRKVRITFQNYFLMKQQEEILQANKKSSAIKMEVNACCVFYIRENPWKYVLEQQRLPEKQGEETFQLPFYCQTFSLKKTTLIEEIFRQACSFWILSDESHTLGDSSFNSLDLLIQNKVLAESYFVAQKETCPYAYFFLWKKEIYVTYLMDEQKQSTKYPQMADIQKGNEDENIKKLEEDIKYLLVIKPGLNLYVNESQDKEEEEYQVQANEEGGAENMVRKKQKETGKIGILTRFFVMALNIVLLVFLITTGLKVFDYEKITYMKQSLTAYILQDGNSQNLEDIYVRMKYLTLINRRNIDAPDEIATEPNQTQVAENRENIDELRFKFLSMVGPIRFLQVRSSPFECDGQALEFNKKVCIYPIYSLANQLTEKLPNKLSKNTTQTWQIFQRPSQTKIPPFDGLMTSYDGSGYVYDIDSYQWVDNDIDILNRENLIDLVQTQMAMLDMLFYDINRDLSVAVQDIFEITPSAQLPQSFILRIYIYKKTTDQNNLNNLEHATLTLGLLITMFSIYLDFKETKDVTNIEWKKAGKQFSYRNDWRKCITFAVLYNLLIGILIVVSYTLYFNHPEKSMREIQEAKTQFDLMDYGSKFELALRIKALLIILVSFNVIVQIKVSHCLVLIMLMFQRSIEQIIVIMILMFNLMLSFSVVYFWTYGQELSEFNFFGRSILSFWGTFIYGNQDTWTKCQNIDSTVNATFTVIMFVTVTYGCLMIINAVMQENYRLISYRNDDEKEVDLYFQQLVQSYNKAYKLITDKYQKLKAKKQH